MAINLYSKASVDSLLSPKLSISSLTNAATTTLNATAPTTNQVLSFDGTQLKWATPAGGATWGSITGTLSSQSDLNTALNARVSTAGDTMDNNAILEFNDTYTNGSLGLTGNAVTLTSSIAPGESGVLNYNQLILTDSVGAMQVNPTGLVFPDSTVQSTAYTGGGTFVGDRLSIYAGYLYNEQTASNVTTLTLGGASTTMQAKNFTLQTGSGGVITFSDGTTQSTAANLTGYAPLASPTFTGTVTIPAGASISGFAPLASPTFTGTVTIPAGASISGFAPLSSPSLAGTPTAPTATVGTNTTQIATTAFVLANAGSSGGCTVNTYGSSTTSGSFTWTKPAGAKLVQVILIGAGGGGGSGARQATTSARFGGGGGAPGTVLVGFIDASRLGSTETVTVAAGNTGGAAITTDNTVGNAGGTTVSQTSFSNFKTTSSGGSGGSGGSTTAGAGGASSTQMLFGINVSLSTTGGGGTSSTGNAGSSNSSYRCGTGGGGGGGAAASSTANSSGGSGGGITTTTAGLVTSVAGGAAGTFAGVAATAGTDSTYNDISGTGGGGGYYRTGVAGGAGAKGGWPGGGGGGGGACDNGVSGGSGKGGDGANGFAVIVTYY